MDCLILVVENLLVSSCHLSDGSTTVKKGDFFALAIITLYKEKWRAVVTTMNSYDGVEKYIFERESQGFEPC